MSDSIHTPAIQGTVQGAVQGAVRGSATARPETPSDKPPYEAPRVLFRQAIDRVAADCSAPPGKGSPIQGCTQGSS